MVLILFFFSSRRRHTRWNCDWSSDVCSSDLERLLVSRSYSGSCWCVSSYGGYGCESRNGQDVGRQANQSLRHSFPLYSVTSGNGSSPRPENICSNSFTSTGCTSLLDAKVSRLLSWNGPPCMSVTSPPASCTISTPAAVSHGLRLNSQNPSKRPQATQHKSSAADPARRTPCVRKVI